MFVAGKLFLELLYTRAPWVKPDMVGMCAKPYQHPFQFKSRYAIAYYFGCTGRLVFNSRPNLLQFCPGFFREGCYVLVNRCRFGHSGFLFKLACIVSIIPS